MFADQEQVGIGRRLFQGFEQGVLGGPAHQFGVEDDEDLVAADEGLHADFFDDFLADDVDSQFGGLVAFLAGNRRDLFLEDHVEVRMITGPGRLAGRTLTTAIAPGMGFPVNRVFHFDRAIAEEDFGQFSGGKSLADPGGPDEDMGVGEPVRMKGLLEKVQGPILVLDISN
jgi:hypothetical protein